MKGMRKILFGLVALFLFAGVVYAADYSTLPDSEGEVAYREKIAIKRQVNGWETVTTDVEGIDNGYVAVGYDCPSAQPGQPSAANDVKLSQSYCTGFMNVYDKEGNSLDGATLDGENGHYALWGITSIKNGYVVLGSGNRTVEGNTEKTTFILELDKNLDIVFEKHLFDKEIQDQEFNHITSYGDTVVVGFDKNVYVFDAATDKVSTLLENQGYLPAVAIDETGIYVASFDTTYNTIVNKYDFDLKGIGTTKLYTRDTTDDTNMGVVTNLNVVEGKLVAALTGNMTLTSGEQTVVASNLLVTCDKDLKNVKQTVIDTTIMDLVASRGEIAYVGYETKVTPSDEAPTVSVSGDELVLNLPDLNVQEGATTTFVRGKYDLNGNKMWKVDYTDKNVIRIDNLLGGVVVAGFNTDEGAGYTIGYEYELFEVATKTDGNGTIEVNKVEGAEGEEVEFIVTPKEGYTLKRVVVTNEFGQTIEFTDYKFTLPSADVEIYAEFEKVVVPNPSTGINNPYISLGLIAAMACGAFIVLKKKKYI